MYSEFKGVIGNSCAGSEDRKCGSVEGRKLAAAGQEGNSRESELNLTDRETPVTGAVMSVSCYLL